MGEFLLEWPDITTNSTIESNTGIPIPRSQMNNAFDRPDFRNGYVSSFDGSPARHMPPMAPPNSLSGGGITLLGFGNDLHRDNALSPNYNDEEMEIKMEPLDDLLDIGNVISPVGMSHSHYRHDSEAMQTEDNLLDNVNFQDLLMTEEYEGATPCLDPQHSSPAAMTTVHPDDVLGILRSSQSNQNYTTSPVGTFPPSSYTPAINMANPTHSTQAASSFPVGFFWKGNTTESPVTPNSLEAFTPSSGDAAQNPPRLTTISSPSPLSESAVYTPLETPSASALHDLLVSSPSSQSPQPQTYKPMQFSSFVDEFPMGQSVPGAGAAGLLASRLSSSAPVRDFSFEQAWAARREPRQHLVSTGSLAEEIGGSTSSLSTGGGVLSPTSRDLLADSEEESDPEHYDSESDNDSLLNDDSNPHLSGMGRTKKERHFWQYNVQAKGPKGHRVNITQLEPNPHRLAKIMDPVFSPLCSIEGIKHSGKARRGDGNDLTPNPAKLVKIGTKLKQLNKEINEMTPVSEQPSTTRQKSRREKNMLASRACRLKKKAQHEANKIKLTGVEEEHKSLMHAILAIKERLVRKVDISQVDLNQEACAGVLIDANASAEQLQQQLTLQIERIYKVKQKHRIASYTTEFVNRVIDSCHAGNSNGGLDTLYHQLSLATDAASLYAGGPSTSSPIVSGGLPEPSLVHQLNTPQKVRSNSAHFHQDLFT